MLTRGEVSQAHASGGHSLDYAEKMYAEYQAGTNGRVVFEVNKREEGPLSGIANVPFGNRLAPRNYLLDGDQVGLAIQNTRFIPLSESQGFDAFMTEELKNTANGFESVGLPVAGGSYRTLRVRATINGERREHEAIEFCWATQNYCTVLDPTVVFADSMAENRVALASSGPLEQESAETSTSGERGTAARCGLASNPAYIGRSLTWAGRWSARCWAGSSPVSGVTRTAGRLRMATAMPRAARGTWAGAAAATTSSPTAGRAARASTSPRPSAPTGTRSRPRLRPPCRTWAPPA